MLEQTVLCGEPNNCSPQSHQDEFPAEYSLASCTPAELASASSAKLIVNQKLIVGYASSANGNCPRTPLSQLLTQATLASRQAVQEGAPLYRQGSFGVQNTTDDAQFWSMDNPTMTPDYANQFGMPGGSGASTPDWIMQGTLKSGASVITRPAPGIGANEGGALEAEMPPGAVDIDWFHML